jgi:hypothetical protein
MGRVRFVSWNIENYGNGIVKQLRGPGVGRLNEFIAAVVATQQVDILGIMEVWPIGVTPLNHLLRCIRAATQNDEWCYDVVKGCVANGVAVGEGNIVGSGSLQWQSGQFAPRREGYAFFWDNGSAEFNMVRSRINMSEGTRYIGNVGPVPGHAVSLSLRGRQTQPRVASPYIEAVGGIDPPNGAFGNWEDSYYPESSNYNAFQVYYDQARRPAYVIVDMRDGANDQENLMPLMIYHTPAANLPAKVGTFMGGMAQELYAIHTRDGFGAWQAGLMAQDNALAAGDYNARVDKASTWNNCYKGFHLGYGGTRDSGANMTPMYTNAAPRRTVVQTNDGFANTGNPINSATPADFYRAPIDEMFERTPNATHSYRRVLIPELVRQGQPLAGNPVSNFVRSINYAIANHDVATGAIGNGGPMRGANDPYYPLLAPTIINDWQDFRAGITQGYMPDARSAALFYRTFISDHLPLLIDYEV